MFFIKTCFSLIVLALTASIVYAQKLTVSSVAQLPEAVSNNAVCEGFLNGDPYLFSFGGIDSSLRYDGIHLRSFRVNLETGQAESIPLLPDTLGKIAAAATRIGDIIYIIGGYHVFADGSELSSNRVHRYRISSNSYLSDGAPIPVPIDDQVQVCWRDSLIYVVTGWSQTANVENVQVYNPATDSWSQATPVFNTNFFKAFGAAGICIQDTIFYFGGASMGANFPPRNTIRFGVIDPNDPLSISWDAIVPSEPFVAYRPAAALFQSTPYWIGGSDVTYNYDGLAYNGSGAVSPSRRYLVLPLANRVWQSATNPDLPMDLRGLAQISDSLAYIAGGIEDNLQVSDEVLQLQFDKTVGLKQAIVKPPIATISPNPATESLQIEWPDVPSFELHIYDSQGQPKYESKVEQQPFSVSVQTWPRGSYIVVLQTDEFIQKRVIQLL